MQPIHNVPVFYSCLQLYAQTYQVPFHWLGDQNTVNKRITNNGEPHILLFLLFIKINK